MVRYFNYCIENMQSGSCICSFVRLFGRLQYLGGGIYIESCLVSHPKIFLSMLDIWIETSQFFNIFGLAVYSF